MSEEDVRGEMLSRFDSSTVRLLDKDTIIVTGPDGKDEYFVKKRQMAIKSKESTSEQQAEYKKRIEAVSL